MVQNRAIVTMADQ